MTISPMLCPAVTVVREPIRLQDSLPCPLGKREKALPNKLFILLQCMTVYIPVCVEGIVNNARGLPL